MADPLQHLPFSSVWKMRIDHPYSLFVRDGAFLWSCGQCPLNESGEVQFPGDLFAQTRAVAGYIDQFLAKMDADCSAVTQLVVYHVKTGDDDGQKLRELLREHFGAGVLVLPVSVPHFYYDGMMVEIDVFGAVGEKTARFFVDDTTRMTLDVIEAGELGYATLLESQEVELETAVSKLLANSGIADRIISEQWFVTTDGLAMQLQAIRRDRLPTQCEVVGIQNTGFAVLGQFILARDSVTRTTFLPRDHGIENVKVSLLRSGCFFEVTGACVEAVGLVKETRQIMHAIEWTLKEHDLSFQNIRKSTTHYIAGSSAEELHNNMSVRNAYYSKPGPASTGLPVLSFPLAPSRISVRIFGKSDTKP
jgi:enamine deaminase RidA (YjgF/YER057c/UK114 family)